MEQHEVPIISLHIIVKEAGSIVDGTGKEGLASLTADLLRKGTLTRTADEISSELDFIGGDFDMNASQDFTSGSAEFLKKDIRQGLDLMADIILNPVFPQNEVTKLIEQRINGIRSAKDRADAVIGRYFYKYLYDEKAYARPVSGDERSLAAITREDIQSFYKENYIPTNVTIAAAGDFSTVEMRALLEERFKSWPGGKFMTRDYAPRFPVHGRRLLLVDKPDSTQTYFNIGYFGIGRSYQDRVAIGLVNTLFGGRFTSRLNTALRIDSGLTYGARSTFDQLRMQGPFFISSYTKNETTEKALDMTLEVLSNFREKGVTQTELDSARTYLKGQFPPTIETTDRLAAMIARLQFYGLDETEINSYYAKLDAVTLAEANQIIKQYFPLNDLVFVLIGKASEIQSIAKKYAPIVDVKTITQPGF
jgi:predicted Zn-dependent peptidase